MWSDQEKNNQEKSRSETTVESGDRRESRTFASAFEGLHLGGSTFEDFSKMTPPKKCPCGCLERDSSVIGFRTRELSTLRLVVHGPEILNYQGTKQAPEDVAPYWKKDSRMWLWKSVRLARRQNNKSKSISSTGSSSALSSSTNFFDQSAMQVEEQ